MKIDCTETRVNLEKIKWAIDCFKIKNQGEKPSYIVMSHKTKNNIINNYYFETVIRGSLNNIEKEDQLFGISVAFNEGLKYGEVDIV